MSDPLSKPQRVDIKLATSCLFPTVTDALLELIARDLYDAVRDPDAIHWCSLPEEQRINHTLMAYAAYARMAKFAIDQGTDKHAAVRAGDIVFDVGFGAELHGDIRVVLRGDE